MPVAAPPAPIPPPDAIARLADVLVGARHPVFLAGRGALAAVVPDAHPVVAGAANVDTPDTGTAGTGVGGTGAAGTDAARIDAADTGVVGNAREALRALAERTGALLATSAVARGLFRGDAFDLDVSGGFASPVAASLIREADLLV